MVAITSIPLSEQQHLVLDGVDWSFYEDVLANVGEQALRVTFSQGSIEIMAPLREHESAKEAIGSLIDVLTIELNIPALRCGSTTFRSEEQQKGLEPDKCYYLRNLSRVKEMRHFDSRTYPPPDLAIEIDITSRSIPRQPIYAALGVPELWRYDGKNLTVLVLDSGGKYVTSHMSPAFPMLPLGQFQSFVHQMDSDKQTLVLREFRDWVKTLPAE